MDIIALLHASIEHSASYPEGRRASRDKLQNWKKVLHKVRQHLWQNCIWTISSLRNHIIVLYAGIGQSASNTEGHHWIKTQKFLHKLRQHPWQICIKNFFRRIYIFSIWLFHFAMKVRPRDFEICFLNSSYHFSLLVILEKQLDVYAGSEAIDNLHGHTGKYNARYLSIQIPNVFNFWASKYLDIQK